MHQHRDLGRRLWSRSICHALHFRRERRWGELALDVRLPLQHPAFAELDPEGSPALRREVLHTDLPHSQPFTMPAANFGPLW
jgi:hypothetical protein